MSKKITIEKIQYTIPTCWQDVSIGDQIVVSKIRDTQKHVKVLALVAGYGKIPIEVLRSIPFSKVENVFKHFKWMNEPIPKEDPKEFEFKGKTYRLLDDFFDMKTEDVVVLLTESENNKENPAETYPLILAVMYRAEDEEFLSDFDVDAKAEMFKELSLPLGHSVYSFFLHLGSVQNLSSLIFNKEVAGSLVLEKNRELQSTLKRLVQVGHGSWFTKLRIGLMIRYLKFLESRWGTFFSSTQSESTTPKWRLKFKRLGRRKQTEKQD